MYLEGTEGMHTRGTPLYVCHAYIMYECNNVIIYILHACTYLQVLSIEKVHITSLSTTSLSFPSGPPSCSLLKKFQTLGQETRASGSPMQNEHQHHPAYQIEDMISLQCREGWGRRRVQ